MGKGRYPLRGRDIADLPDECDCEKRITALTLLAIVGLSAAIGTIYLTWNWGCL